MLLKDLNVGDTFKFGDSPVVWKVLPLPSWMTGVQHVFCESLYRPSERLRPFRSPLPKFVDVVLCGELGI